MQASALANNDLNNMILNEKIEGEFGNNFYRMSRNLKNLISNLEQIIGKVKSVSNGIIKTSELITNSALDINEKVEVQSVIAKDNEVFLNQFNSSINKISDNCDDTTSNASNSTKLLRKGLEIIDDINNEMANMRDSIKTTGSKLNELSESGRKISNIIDMITGISEKTALLALNAAIEAARAGESGRGFAVVADEVNKLAEQTNKSVKEISMLVETIKTQTDLSVESMNENIKLVEKVVEFIDNTSGSFNQINSAVDETSKSINTISDTVEEQNEAIKSMIENSDKLKNISEQFSVSAVSLTENGKELKSFADNLEEVLNAKI
jgi:methyl-accepting chemotaxis protein